MRRAWTRWIQPALLGFGGATAVSVATGIALNLFLGGVAYAAVMTPMLVQQYPRARWRAAGLFNLMIAIVWLMAVPDHVITPGQWVSLAAVLAAVAAAELALGELLESIGLPVVAAATWVLLAAITWATWPIWGSVHLGDAGAPHVVPLHPLFAINGVVPGMGIWTEQPTPYRLTAFGQNVVYRLPVTVVPCVALHSALAGLGVGLRFVVRGGALTLKRPPTT